jgi:hypothetical protein
VTERLCLCMVRLRPGEGSLCDRCSRKLQRSMELADAERDGWAHWEARFGPKTTAVVEQACTICGRPADRDLCPRCDEDVDRDYDRRDHAS